jgi:hypothetical protein
LGGLGLEACDELAGFFVVLLFFGALGRRRTNVTFCHLKPEFAPIFVVEVEAPNFCSSLLRFACSEGRSPFELRRSPPRPANAGGRKSCCVVDYHVVVFGRGLSDKPLKQDP